MDSQASGADFGAQIGAAVQNLGAGVMDVAQALHQQEVENETAKVHVELAKTRKDLQQMVIDETNAAQPGDDKFVSRVSDKIDNYLQSSGAQFQTRHAQNLYSTMSADMKAMYQVQAVEQQARLSGVAATNNFRQLGDNLGAIAAQDHTQWKSLIAQGTAAIKDPNGPYAKVPEVTRQELLRELENNVKYAAAEGFARRYPNAVLGSVPQEIRTQVQQIVANPPKQGEVPDLKAPIVKPYKPDMISGLAARVAAPSPYDKFFEDAARQYNLDPKELKMRAVAESGLNPTAVSSQNSGGIMQFTPATATQLGVDRMDPKASIFAAAKLIAGYRAQANGDMSVVDKMYYGGAAGTAWGPNTKQYAANLSGLRQAIGLGSSVPPEAFAPTATEQMATATQPAPGPAGSTPAEFKKPSTGIDFIDTLPANRFFDVLTKAEHYQRAMESQGERARLDAEREKKAAQDAAMRSMYARIIEPTPGNGGQISEHEILANPMLTMEQQHHMIQIKLARARELAAEAEPKTNPKEVRNLMLQIHAADDDPSKTYNMSPIDESYKAGRISTAEYKALRTEVEQMRDGNSNGFQKDVNAARNAVYTALTRSILGQAQPEVAADAAYRFNADMEKQIAELRKQNKDPRTLLDPDSRDYLLKPARIQSFMTPGAAGQAAAKAAATQASTLPTSKDYDSLKPGTPYTDPQGNIRVKGGK